jgi:glycosyltransferase involved in cell wall biosynthesis
MTNIVSLIVCTVGRHDLLARLLASLKTQTSTAFELIVVDQSDSKEIEENLKSFSAGQSVRHIRSEKGLSRARNVGLLHAQGDIVGFPDDDCWYGDRVIEQVLQIFDSPESGVLTGRTVDREGTDSVSFHRPESGIIDRHNVFDSGNSNTLFARIAAAKDVGGFDETLGVGAATPFQSGEETDFLLRCLKKGYQLYYDRDFNVHHDQTDSSAAVQVARARAYSQGHGRVLRVHAYGVGYLGIRIGRAAVRGAICLVTGDRSGARQRYSWASGSLRGFLAHPQGSEPLP